MKEYSLDFAPPLAPSVDEAELVPPPARSSWRSIVLLIVLESLALALLYGALIGFPGPSAASIETAAVHDPTFATATPAPVQAQASVPAEAEPVQAGVVEPGADAAPSRISREHGRYVIELHSSAIGPALEMLTKATGATVRGTEVLAGNATRITRTVATDSALEAWQAVFGGVANFAATCNKAACAVRFVRASDLAKTPAFPGTPAAPLAPQFAGAAAQGDPPAD
jgi:hypothetical protein